MNIRGTEKQSWQTGSSSKNCGINIAWHLVLPPNLAYRMSGLPFAMHNPYNNQGFVPFLCEVDITSWGTYTYFIASSCFIEAAGFLLNFTTRHNLTLWKPVNNIHTTVDKQTLHTTQPGTSDAKWNIYGSPNDLLSEHRSPVTGSILFRDSQYFRAERELRVQFLDMLIEY